MGREREREGKVGNDSGFALLLNNSYGVVTIRRLLAGSFPQKSPWCVAFLQKRPRILVSLLIVAIENV